MSTSKKLTYTKTGTGPALVLVHGYFGGDAHWEGQIEAFARYHTVIAINLAGFGNSSTLTAPNRIEGHAHLVWAVLDALKINRASILGHSMGGMVVQAMATIHPHRIEKVILYGTGPVGSLPGRFETIQRSRERLHTDGLEPTLQRIAATWLVDGEQSVGYQPCLETGRKTTMQAALAALDAWEAWDGTPNLPAISATTLVIRGSEDRSYPLSQAQALTSGIPNARYIEISGCGHAAHLEQPELFNNTVIEFMQGDA